MDNEEQRRMEGACYEDGTRENCLTAVRGGSPAGRHDPGRPRVRWSDSHYIYINYYIQGTDIGPRFKLLKRVCHS
jgi:hypothetical protein